MGKSKKTRYMSRLELEKYVQELELEVNQKKVLEDDRVILIKNLNELRARAVQAEDRNERVLDLMLEWWCIDDIDWVQSRIETIYNKSIEEIIEEMRNK